MHEELVFALKPHHIWLSAPAVHTACSCSMPSIIDNRACVQSYQYWLCLLLGNRVRSQQSYAADNTGGHKFSLHWMFTPAVPGRKALISPLLGLIGACQAACTGLLWCPTRLQLPSCCSLLLTPLLLLVLPCTAPAAAWAPRWTVNSAPEPSPCKHTGCTPCRSPALSIPLLSRLVMDLAHQRAAAGVALL